MSNKYVHTELVHNLEAPKQIVPLIMGFLKPRSVVDVGCGIGTFLYCFKKEGVQKVLGIDGHWVNKELLRQYIAEDEFMQCDLEKPINLKEKFDLAVSLEVAEHLKADSARTFIKSLTELSDVVLFSAAVPFQGGQNHINEQPPSYWQKLFEECGFEFHDVIRDKVWENDKIFSWYKQNMFLAAKNGHALNPQLFEHHTPSKARFLIHPAIFRYRMETLEKYESGDYSIKAYLKMLGRALIRKAGLRKKG